MPKVDAFRSPARRSEPDRRPGAPHRSHPDETGLFMKLLCSMPVFLVLAGSALPALADPSELLSIRGITLPEHGYVEAFRIDTWSVRVLAVCRLPPGWTITAGKSADPSGILAGEASLGSTYLNNKNLDQLHQLFLIEVSDYRERELPMPNVPGGVHPATFSGKLVVGTYGTHDDAHEVSITPANLLREPATHCP
jgi:hypothetical protein